VTGLRGFAVFLALAAFGCNDHDTTVEPACRTEAGPALDPYSEQFLRAVRILIHEAIREGGGELVTVRIRGGLLGHWSVWTRGAVEILARIHAAIDAGAIDPALLALDAQVTDANSAFFDVANDFRGCIAGCHEVLRRQGLLEGIWCLDPAEGLSPGQAAELDRVHAAYPALHDDGFVREHLARWLG